MMLLNKTIRLFLDSIGRREEYEFYLNKFQSAKSPCFSILCPDFSTLEQTAEMFTFDLQFLSKLGLRPLILLSGEDAEASAKLLQNFDQNSYSFFWLNSPGDCSDVLSFVNEVAAENRFPVVVAQNFSPITVLQKLMNLLTNRVHFVRSEGGIHSETGEELFFFYTETGDHSVLSESDHELVDFVEVLLKRCPGAHVSVTSCLNLIREIFTVKGAGTMFRKGSKIEEFTDRADVDEIRLYGLLEESFGRKLVKKDPFSSISDFIIDTDYRGAALLEKNEAGFYLSKFAVGAEARGEGLAQELWRVMCNSHEAIFWRSRKDNPINHWYDRMADGNHTSGKWQIFWKGIDPDLIPLIIKDCLARSEDFASA